MVTNGQYDPNTPIPQHIAQDLKYIVTLAGKLSAKMSYNPWAVYTWATPYRGRHAHVTNIMKGLSTENKIVTGGLPGILLMWDAESKTITELWRST